MVDNTFENIMGGPQGRIEMHIKSWEFARSVARGACNFPASALQACSCVRRVAVSAVLAGCFLLAAATADPIEASEGSDYFVSIAEYRAEREEELRGPDGWLNLAGLYWLGEGKNSMGSAPDNDIVLKDLPAAPRLGEFMVDGEDVVFRVERGAEVFSGGEAVTELRLVHDEAGRPTVLTHGTLAWHAIHRMGQMGVRMRNLNHPAVSAFPGIKSYPTDTAWRVAARFEAYEQPQERILSTVVEGLGWKPVAPGTLEFEVGGEPLSLEAYAAGPGFLLIFADLTTGKTTYPAGRYLYAFGPGPEGAMVLDFNKAINPPCAFTDFATCPLPQPRNRLKIAIEAGEQYGK